MPHAGGTANPDSETVLVLLRADSTLTAGGTEAVQWSHTLRKRVRGMIRPICLVLWGHCNLLITECQPVLYGEISPKESEDIAFGVMQYCSPFGFRAAAD